MVKYVYVLWVEYCQIGNEELSVLGQFGMKKMQKLWLGTNVLIGREKLNKF